MPAAHVKTGIWELYDEPFHKRWIWTVLDTHAFWMLGFYVLFLVVVQKRAWVSLRYFVYLWKKPVRLDTGSDQRNPLLELSQMKAVKAMLERLAFITLQWFREMLVRFRWIMINLRNDWKNNIGFKGILTALARALSNILLTPFRSCMRKGYEEVDYGSVSAWFGIAAFLNGIIFMVTGVLLPFLLTNGIETPIVRSQRTSYCDVRLWQPTPIRNREIQSIANTKYEQCWDRKLNRFNDGPECSTRPLNFEVKNLPGYCPYKENICTKGTEVVQITARNITFREMGINSRSTLTISHRLECTPVDEQRFIRVFNNSLENLEAIFSVLDTNHLRRLLAANRQLELEEMYVGLETLNGPNQWTRESSGQIISNRSRKYIPGRTFKLPSSRGPLPNITDSPDFPFHESIGSQNASIIFVLYTAGREMYYNNPVEDPVFGAHIKVDGLYHADYEAKAIGCLEQFSFCLDVGLERVCTPWDKPGLWMRCIFEYFNSEKILYEVIEALQSLLRVYRLLSVEQYTWLNTMITEAMQGSHGFTSVDRYANAEIYKNRTTLWRDEVISWCLKSYWSARARIQSVATTANSAYYFKSPPEFDGDDVLDDLRDFSGMEEFAWCSRILLEDGNFTNINLFGFLISLAAMALIYITSYLHALKKFAARKLLTAMLSRTGGFINVRSVRVGMGTWYRRRFNRADAFQLTRIWKRRTETDGAEASSGDPIPHPAGQGEIPQYRDDGDGGDDESDIDFPLPLSESSRRWLPF